MASLSLQAQTKPKEKIPAQKELEAMMKEAQQMMSELSDEDKKMLDSLGIKMPDFKKGPALPGKQLADAGDRAGGLVPKRNAARIAQIPKAIAAGQMLVYISATNQKAFRLLHTAVKVKAEELVTRLRKQSGSS